MTDINELIAEMRAGLEGVTPGKWRQVFSRDLTGDIGIKADGVVNVIAEVFSEIHAAGQRSSAVSSNAAHIERCSPDNIAALLDTLTALKRENEELREALTGLIEDFSSLASGHKSTYRSPNGICAVDNARAALDGRG